MSKKKKPSAQGKSWQSNAKPGGQKSYTHSTVLVRRPPRQPGR